MMNIPSWLKDTGFLVAACGIIVAIIKAISDYFIKKVDQNTAIETSENTTDLALKKLTLEDKDGLIHGMDAFQKSLMGELESVRKELWAVKEKVSAQQNEILNLMLENFNIRNENTLSQQKIADLTSKVEMYKLENDKLKEALLISDKKVSELEKEISIMKTNTETNTVSIASTQMSVEEIKNRGEILS